ncbi:LytR/AlgR family response regulator transcription factor [Marinicella litoralis]|uniref:LytTR family two component transcriptional regulator n=1 Tax=Marinicella litoralis TaxID=644220 RepID=A0A4R6XQ57_9GAMM|nr:LytTR family DNA-binding domain-containing protein [Marinicella litoralis]TDR20539.1 LytTR family two component transcriptional regulator [Marinicella litoralis]
MKVLIVDDEPLARIRLKHMLNHLHVEHVFEANNGIEAVSMASKNMPDLIFMDIEMPELNGMEAAQQIKQSHPNMPIIFSTAHDDFALKAFDLAAIDYLLKPLSIDRLKQALNKVGLKPSGEKITVKKGNDVIMVAVDDIICMMAEDKYVTAYLSDQTLILDQSLADLEKLSNQYLRVHRSCLVNVNYLKGIHMNQDHKPSVILDKTDIKPVISRRQMAAVKKLIKQL